MLYEIHMGELVNVTMKSDVKYSSVLAVNLV